MSELQKNFKYFYEISKIPRKSFHEEKVVDYIEEFAKSHGYEYERDAIHNIIVRKPGSKGRENEAPLILQAHTDMVCNKDEGVEHDFLKDPIEIMEVDGFLTANGTTLGADDGAGVANILGLLDEEDLSNPPLECVFTVQEEDGMGGAKALDMSGLKSKRMIGLDGIQEGTTIYSASAVKGCKFKADFKTVDKADVKKNGYVLKVSGLTSGHGALMIGSGRANAIKVSARILQKLICTGSDIELCSMTGGGLIHVIPGSCDTEFACDLKLEEIIDKTAEIIAQIKLEYADTDPKMEISLEKVEPGGGKGYADAAGCAGKNAGAVGSGKTYVDAGDSSKTYAAAAESGKTYVDASDSARFINLLYLLPVGAYRRTPDKLEQVEGSFNLSIMRMGEGRMAFDVVCRSNYPVDIQDLQDIMESFAKLFNVECERTLDYDGYHVPIDSPLIRIWNDVYKEDTGKDIGLTFMHSALDAGTICRTLGVTDMVVIMPTTPDVHTTRERMNIDSFRRTYLYLKEILRRA